MKLIDKIFGYFGFLNKKSVHEVIDVREYITSEINEIIYKINNINPFLSKDQILDIIIKMARGKKNIKRKIKNQIRLIEPPQIVESSDEFIDVIFDEMKDYKDLTEKNKISNILNDSTHYIYDSTYFDSTRYNGCIFSGKQMIIKRKKTNDSSNVCDEDKEIGQLLSQNKVSVKLLKIK